MPSSGAFAVADPSAFALRGPLPMVSGEPLADLFTFGGILSQNEQPKAILLLTQGDSPYSPARSQLLSDCLTDLQRDRKNADLNVDTFDTYTPCVNLGRVNMAISDRRTFQRTLQGWLQVHSFIAREGLEEAQLQEAATGIGIPGATSTVSAPALEKIMGAVESGLGYMLDVNSRYTFWSGITGGFFLAMAYFGTDQSQVGRFLTGRSVEQSRMGLLFNGLAKVPMQFVVLGVGAMVFAFYLFTPPPVFFNPQPVRAIEQSALAPEFARAAQRQNAAAAERAAEAMALVEARRQKDPVAIEKAGAALEQAHREVEAARGATVDVLQRADSGLNRNDVNYVFLRFVLMNLPIGIIGLVLAMVFSASMSASSAEMSALSSTTIVDVWKRWLGGGGSPHHELVASRWITLMWGVFAIGFAEFAGRLGSLVEAVNVLGSLFYGTILGIFLTAFYLKRVTGTPVFIAAIVAEGVVLACYFWSKISFLWFNVVGCLVVVILASVLSALLPRRT